MSPRSTGGSADITITTPTRSLSAYLRAPHRPGPWPGVVVLHDVLGQTKDSRMQVDWLAESGYLSVAPDLYSWGNKLYCIQSVVRDLISGKGSTFADINATRAAIASHPDCTGKVGVIGFCQGGGFALMLAASSEFAVASVNYGHVPKNLETLLARACPVVGSFGARDFALKGAAARLTAALEANAVAHCVKEYVEVGHGFLNDHDGVAGWIMARLGMRYNEAAAADARARILDFFNRYLHDGVDEYCVS